MSLGKYIKQQDPMPVEESLFYTAKRIKPWGLQEYLFHTKKGIIKQLNFSGDSKQRRQQRRELLRKLNQ